MDVPFVSSGAMSRSHYALVRKVETASTPQQIDHYVHSEVEAVRSRLAHSTLTSKQCKESLIMLLYSAMVVNPGSAVDTDFALLHAINLAEAGLTVQDKKIGYLFCAEMMPPGHELQLMLVNTLRKDLESNSIPRICLALDTLIQSTFEDVIPAVQDRLYELLSHNSVHIRRRALLVFRALARYDQDILRRIVDKVRKRIFDPQPVVVSAALTVSTDLIEAGILVADEFRPVLAQLLRETWKARGDRSRHWLLVKTLQALSFVKPSPEEATLILEITRASSAKRHRTSAVIRQCFLSVQGSSLQSMLAAQIATRTSFSHEIRPLLVSEDMNEIYLFVICLECLEPALWAGTSSEIPAVLEGWEVERVMKLLHSSDQMIRVKTLRLLYDVDHSILETYYTQLLQGDVSAASIIDAHETARRALEVIKIFCGEDGELYAQHVKNILQSTERDSKTIVVQEVVEEVLVRIHHAESTFRSGCIGALFTSVVDLETKIGPTFVVILSALFSEYLANSPVPPSALLQGLAGRVSAYSASIQDACLLSMLRIAAECDEIPSGVTNTVTKLHEQAGRHMKRRCDQFLNMTSSTGSLRRVVASANSSSLPDFLASLESYQAEKASMPIPSQQVGTIPSLERPLHQNSASPAKLRYTAYEPPKVVPRLRRLSGSSSQSTTVSEDGQSKFLGQSRILQDEPMSRTVTAGDLTLAASRMQIGSRSSSGSHNRPIPLPQILDNDDSITHADLIALDSPFIDPSSSAASSVAEPDFQGIWDALEQFNFRGWCEAPLDIVLRRLQTMEGRLRVIATDQPPFVGELKVIITSHEQESGSFAVLRLRDGSEDSCLWRLRCEDDALRSAVQALL